MEIKQYKSVKKGAFDGYLDIYIPEMDWTIKSCCLFIKEDGSRSIAPPTRQYKNDEGATHYAPLIWMGKEARSRFSQEALKAYDLFNVGSDTPDIFSE